VSRENVKRRIDQCSVSRERHGISPPDSVTAAKEPMTPGQLREKAKRHFGDQWAKELAPIVGYAPDTIRDWSHRYTTIPARAAAAFQAWEVEQKNRRAGDQYSSASMIVRTRVVFAGSAGSSEPNSSDGS
jgi:hypothetical protein